MHIAGKAWKKSFHGKSCKIGKNIVMEAENILKSHGISLLLITNHAWELPVISYL